MLCFTIVSCDSVELRHAFHLCRWLKSVRSTLRAVSPPMGWVEVFAAGFDDGSEDSVFKVIGEVNVADVGVD